jgi:hypothetical protein
LRIYGSISGNDTRKDKRKRQPTRAEKTEKAAQGDLAGRCTAFRKTWESFDTHRQGNGIKPACACQGTLSNL